MGNEFAPDGKGIRNRDDFGNFEANLEFLDSTGVLAAGRRILEIGSGKGRLLHRLVAAGYQIHGIEPDRDFLVESRRLYGTLPLLQMDAQHLAFADAAFDVVLSFDVFEHIPDSDRHLEEVKRVLRPGGYYLLQTPNKWLNVVFETIRYRSVSAWRADHCSLHNLWQLRRRFARHGFTTQFEDIRVVNEWFRRKVAAILGAPGLLALRLSNPDQWPLFMKTNFYLSARKAP